MFKCLTIPESVPVSKWRHRLCKSSLMNRWTFLWLPTWVSICSYFLGHWGLKGTFLHKLTMLDSSFKLHPWKCQGTSEIFLATVVLINSGGNFWILPVSGASGPCKLCLFPEPCKFHLCCEHFEPPSCFRERMLQLRGNSHIK